MTIWIVGSGDARDHALYEQLVGEGSPVSFALLGDNALLWKRPGVERVVDVEAALRRIDERGSEVVVVQRPELLFAGIGDALIDRGHRFVGPGSRAARLESSKIEAKQFMQDHGVATPASFVFDAAASASAFLRERWSAERRFVIKADRYLSDPDVRSAVPSTLDQAIEAVQRLDAVRSETRGARFLVESRVAGTESSIHLLLDGERSHLAPPVSDYKTLHDGDQGPNTHGLGAVAGGGFSAVDHALLEERVIAPSLRGLAQEGRGYRGVLYIGVMWTDEGPIALEYNVRPGNPEWVALLPLLTNRLGDLLRRDDAPAPEWRTDLVSGCVFCAVAGYPLPRALDEVAIDGLDTLSPSHVVGEGLRVGPRGFVAGEGRSFCVRATGPSIETMRQQLYGEVAKVRFPGMHYRRDIGLGRSIRAFQGRP